MLIIRANRGGGRGILYTYGYIATTTMTPALRWAAMRDVLEKGEKKQIRTARSNRFTRCSECATLYTSAHLSTDAVSTLGKVWVLTRLQALLYDILPSTTAVFSYAIGSRKLSANEQFFVGAQTVVTLLQTTQMISDVCFINDHVTYASSDKTKII